MGIKIAFIGAGSIGFTRKLTRDILSVPELQDSTISYMDIDKKNLGMVTQLMARDIKAGGIGAKLESTTNRKKALEGADYVINCTRIGGLEAYQYDIDIPLKYNIDQCVGDTLCAGGIMYGQRNIAAVLDFCADMREVSSSDVLFLSYANPNAMNTWAANKYGKINTLGLCHGVTGGHRQICEVISLMINKGKKPGSKSYREVKQKDVDITCCGINHQTWYIKVLFDGKDWARNLLEGFEAHPVYSKTEKVRIDMMKRFGYYSTESNGHLSEYVPWYRKRSKEIRKWISMDSWINGETGGYLRVSTEGRNWFEMDFPKWLAEEPEGFLPENRGHEHAGYIIEALETGRVYRGHFNLVNNGTITNLPDEAVIETPCYVDKNGISVPKIGDLPLGCAAVCNSSISVQRMAVEAAVSGDVELLKQSMMMDPLVGAVCNPPEIWQMVDEMLVAQAKWLPQYKKEIPLAKKRLSRNRIKVKGSKGAARKKIRMVADLRKQGEKAKKSVLAADKAEAQREEQAQEAKRKSA